MSLARYTLSKKAGPVARALQRAHVFAARKVHWTLRLSVSALRIAFSRYALSEKVGRRATRDFALSAHYVILFKLSFVMRFSTMIDVENSPSGLWRTLGKRVGVTASRVRISYSPRVGFLANS